jgi:thiamine-phosphate pyrophosphorylase
MTAGARWELGRRRLYLCTPDRPDLASFLEACIVGGVDVVQLRDKHLDDGSVVARAVAARTVCAAHGVPFVLNDRPDLALEAGADGVHVGQDDVDPAEARALLGPEALIGLSTHAPAELAAALGDGGPGEGSLAAPVDYLSAGPVVPTPTKPGRPGTGLGYVTEAVARSPWPVWVTGGASPDSVGALVGAGARHVVVVRWLTEADDPGGAARALRQAIDAAIDAAEESAIDTDAEADGAGDAAASQPPGRRTDRRP